MMDRIGSRTPLPPVRVIESTRNSAQLATAGAARKVTSRSLPPSLAADARALAKSPPVDAARIAALKAAIHSNNYRIDVDTIANKMVELDVPAQR